MRLIVFFDLPTITHQDKKAYTLFRRFLIKDGYDMIQWSVYGRIINGFDNLETHLQRLTANLPPEGSIRCLQVSEKQFAQMKLLVGLPKKQEKTVTAAQLVLL
ncbi:MAG: CRISPR-associated endonuclease Cas2 [Porticoccaceae bacterium]